MISDCHVWQSTHTHNSMCTHEQHKSSDYNQVILAHVDVVQTANNSVFKICNGEGQRVSTTQNLWYPPPPHKY